MRVVYVSDLDRRVRRALLFIDVAVSRLKSASAGDPGVEVALSWLRDARSELQSLLDGTLRDVVVLIDAGVAAEVGRRAGVRAEDAVEALIYRCIEEYLSGRG